MTENKFAKAMPDEELEQVNGGIKIMPKNTKIISTILRLIFKIKKNQNDRQSNAESDKDTD